MHHALCVQTEVGCDLALGRGFPEIWKLAYTVVLIIFLLNFRKSGVLGGKSMEDQRKRKFHNSQSHKAFSVPQIPEGETIFPANKFITTPAEPSQMKKSRWELAGGGKRARQKGILAPSSGQRETTLVLTVPSKDGWLRRGLFKRTNAFHTA